MIMVERIWLGNFRRYREADFKFNSSEDRNFNVILARNGVGKSTLFDAFTWCLFDTEDHLQIDPRYFDEAEDILNNQIKKNLVPNSGTKVKVSVVFFDTKRKEHYKIDKDVSYQKDSNGEVLSGTPKRLIFKKGEKDRDWTKITEVPAAVVIERLIPKNLRQFFFFDGEKLRVHFEKNASSYLKEKIEQVSRVDVLDKVIEEVRIYYNEIHDKKRRSITDAKLQKLNMEIEEMERNVGGLEDSNRELNAEMDDNRRRKKLVMDELTAHGARLKNIGTINEQYASTEREIGNAQRHYSEILSGHRDLIMETTPFVFLGEKIHSALECVNVAVQKKLAPPPLTEDYLNQLMNEGVCICGTSLSGGDNEHRERIIELTKTVKGVKTVNYSEGQFMWDHWLQKIRMFEEESKHLNENLGESEEELGHLKDKLEELRVARRSDEVEAKIRLLQMELDGLDSDYEGYLTKKTENQVDLEILRPQLSRDKREFAEKENRIGKNKLLFSKEEYSWKILEELDRFKGYLVKKNIGMLTKKTEENLIKLLTEKRGEIESVEVGGDYELRIRSKTDPSKNLRHTLSAGETHIFVLSFAAALRTVTGFNAPLVIDTPLGKIDMEYRMEVVKALPDIFKNTQVVFLVTDSEYTESIRSTLKGKLGDITEYEVVRDPKEAKFNLIREMGGC